MTGSPQFRSFVLISIEKTFAGSCLNDKNTVLNVPQAERKKILSLFGLFPQISNQFPSIRKNENRSAHDSNVVRVPKIYCDESGTFGLCPCRFGVSNVRS